MTFSKIKNFLIIVFLATNIHSQNIESYNWNPLHVGNMWEFEDTEGYHSQKKVLKDTLIEGRLYYKVVQLVNYYGRNYICERNADNAVYMYDLDDLDNNPDTKELLCDSLNAPIGTTYISYRYYGQFDKPSEITIKDRYEKYLDVYATTALVTEISRVPVITDNDGVAKPMVEENETWAENYGLETYAPEQGYEWLVGAIIDGVTYGTVSTINPNHNSAPQSSILFQNYPNPFNPKTTIKYKLRVTDEVNLSIYSILGEKVATLVSEKQQAGFYQCEWDASGFSSGVYFYCLSTSSGYTFTRKLIVLK